MSWRPPGWRTGLSQVDPSGTGRRGHASAYRERWEFAYASSSRSSTSDGSKGRPCSEFLILVTIVSTRTPETTPLSTLNEQILAQGTVNRGSQCTPCESTTQRLW